MSWSWCLSAADEGDDLQLVTVAEARVEVIGLGNDLSVAFDGDLTGVNAEVSQQLMHGHRSPHGLRRAVGQRAGRHVVGANRKFGAETCQGIA